MMDIAGDVRLLRHKGTGSPGCAIPRPRRPRRLLHAGKAPRQVTVGLDVLEASREQPLAPTQGELPPFE